MEKRLKAWGEEVIIVNTKYYAGKILYIKKDGCSSIHYHNTKDETFYLTQGTALLVVGKNAYWIEPGSKPVRVCPGEHHMFVGITDCSIIEFSTEDKEDDTIRFTKSKSPSF